MFLEAIESRSSRAAPRTRVLMTGTLMTPGGAVAVRIRDISSSGAQIWVEHAIPANCDAILKRGSFFAAVRIVRSAEHAAGVEFYRQLSGEELMSALQPRARTSAALV